MRCSRISALAVVAVVVGAAPDAHAGAKMSAAARRQLDRGEQLFEQGDYAEAIATFDAGFAIEPHPDFLYAKGQAQRLSGDCVGAIASYRGYLASRPPAREAEATHFNIARCEAELAKQLAERRDEPALPAPAPPPADTTVAAPAWYRDWVGGVLAGGALIGVGVGATMLVVADRAVDRANNADFLPDYVHEKEFAHSRRVIGVVSLIAGGVLATAAVVRYATRPSRIEITQPAAGDGAVITIGGRF
jgi:tetratricopeptide (TPR) repeat protein